MCRGHFVLVLVTWYFGAAHSWDFAVSLGDKIIFYTSGGTKTDTVHFESHNVTEITYDEFQNRILYVDKQSDNQAICGYYLTSKENKCFLRSFDRNIRSIAYDPVTENFFFTDTIKKSINWISLKPRLNTLVYDLIEMDDRTPRDIAVDSCRGYIYWSNGNNMERTRLNGSEREAVVYYPYGSTFNIFNLAINTQTEKIYYIDGQKYYYLYSADLDGHNVHEHQIQTLIKTEPKQMTVSKGYIYWLNSNNSYNSVWQYPKNPWFDIQPKELLKFSDRLLGLAANYKIDDQIKGVHDCDALSRLLPITEAPATTQRCDVSVCDNYCLRGTCSVNDEGLPKCSCNAGHTGPRCQVDVCLGYCSNNGDCSLNENHQPVCQCKGDYSGHRCEISDCLNYCVHGNCSLSDEGHPTCSCDAGYSGERCEVSACHGYCLNDGECSLNEEDEPFCQCVGNHEGSRCEADINETTPIYELSKRNLTLTDVLSIWRNTSSNIYLTVNNYNNFTNSSVTIGGQNGQNFMGPRPDGAQTPKSTGGH